MPHLRYALLDGLRGVAAISIMLYHVTQHSAVPIFRNAHYAVDLFFCLSGFVLWQAYAPRLMTEMTSLQFTVVRLVRMYPMFLIGLCLGLLSSCVLLLSGLTDRTWQTLTMSFVVNAALLPFENDGWVQIGGDRVFASVFPLNDPGWSLMFELLVNIAFAVLLKRALLGRFVLWGIVLGTAVIFLQAIAVGQGTFGFGSGARQFLIGLDRTLFGFFLGVLVAKHAPTLRFENRGLVWTVLLFGVVLVVCQLPGGRLSHLLAILSIPCLVYLGSGVTPKGALDAACRWLGDLSYPLYCIHFPAIGLFAYLWPEQGGAQPARLAVYSATCIVGSAILVRYVDVPVRAWLSQMLTPGGRSLPRQVVSARKRLPSGLVNRSTGP